MKIVCPACDAAYDVPASVLAAPRKMRCARCGHDWVPRAEPPEAPVPPPAPVPAAPAVHEETHDPSPVREAAPPAEEVPDEEPAPEPEPEIVSQSEPEPVEAPLAPLEELVFTPASFTSFETLPPVVDPLADTGFEPLNLHPTTRQSASAIPLLHPVPPRQPGDIDPILAALPPERLGPSTTTVNLAWAVSIVILLAAGWAGWQWRFDIMTVWKPSQRFYEALGTPAPPG